MEIAMVENGGMEQKMETTLNPKTLKLSLRGEKWEMVLGTRTKTIGIHSPMPYKAPGKQPETKPKPLDIYQTS